MATTLLASLSLSGDASVTDGALDSGPTDDVQIGNGGFPACDYQLADGTGADQAQKLWHDQRSVGATSNDDLDLTNLAGRLVAQNPVNFARVLVVLVKLVAPDGALKLNVGPQGVANAWQGPFGGVAAGNYHAVTDCLFFVTTKGATPGWTVDGTHKVLRVANPGGAAVAYQILVLGV